MNEYESPTLHQLGGEDNMNQIGGAILVVFVILAFVLFVTVIEVAAPPPLY